MKLLTNTFAVAFSYPVLFTEKVFSPDNTVLKDLLRASGKGKKIMFVIDKGVADHWTHLEQEIKNYFKEHLPSIKCCDAFLTLPGGEEIKNSSFYMQQTLEAIEQNGLCRHSFLAAVGGGALLDMAGFAATIAHRGIKHIHIPTTVLSQNDSGIGVKNGINAFGKKNFIGTFAPPYAVINDSEFLTTLCDRDWRSGIAEAIKVALIKDLRFFEFLEAHALSFTERDMTSMKQLIHRCAELHMQHIGGGDPFETGSSRPLDFGHWSAHKLEQLSGYRIRHGEAVAIGIALDATISLLTGMLCEEDWERTIMLLTQTGFSIFSKELKTGVDKEPEVWKGLGEFREHLGGMLTIMLLEGIGKGREVHEVSKEVVVQAINILQERQHTLDKKKAIKNKLETEL